MNSLSKTMQKSVLQLAAIALLLNALVPVGFMLHPTGGAGLTMVLCPDQGALPGYSVEEHHPSGTGEQFSALGEIGDENTCAFSLVGGPLLGGTVLTIQLRDLVAVVVQPPQVAVLAQSPRSSFSVRGPPKFS